MIDFFKTKCYPLKKEEDEKMKGSYQTSGVCAKRIDYEVEDGIIKSVRFICGCAGNTLGISKLVVGMKVQDVIDRLEGNPCGAKPTSCPDQLAKALKETL